MGRYGIPSVGSGPIPALLWTLGIKDGVAYDACEKTQNTCHEWHSVKGADRGFGAGRATERSRCVAEFNADARSSRSALRRAGMLLGVGCGGVLDLLPSVAGGKPGSVVLLRF